MILSALSDTLSNTSKDALSARIKHLNLHSITELHKLPQQISYEIVPIATYLHEWSDECTSVDLLQHTLLSQTR